MTAIIIALGALIASLLVLGWAYGDFNPPKEPTASNQTPPERPT